MLLRMSADFTKIDKVMERESHLANGPVLSIRRCVGLDTSAHQRTSSDGAAFPERG